LTAAGIFTVFVFRSGSHLVGGLTAMGCTIGQGVTGLSTLAVGSFFALAAMIVGCAATLKCQYWRAMQEKPKRKSPTTTGRLGRKRLKQLVDG
jgi:hypothetical protein